MTAPATNHRPRMSIEERSRTEQRREAEKRRQQTLARLRWAKGRGQTVEELADRMDRDHNPVLRDLNDLRDRADAYERDGLWFIGCDPDPNRPRQAKPQQAVDLGAVVLEVLGDGEMFSGELIAAVEVHAKEFSRGAIALKLGKLRDAGEILSSGGLLRRRPNNAAVEGCEDTPSTDRQGAGAPATVQPRPDPAPVAAAGAAPASVGASSPVGGDRPSPPDSGAPAERDPGAFTHGDQMETIDLLDPSADEIPPAAAVPEMLTSGSSISPDRRPAEGEGADGVLAGAAPADEDLEAGADPGLEVATGAGVEAGAPSSTPSRARIPPEEVDARIGAAAAELAPCSISALAKQARCTTTRVREAAERLGLELRAEGRSIRVYPTGEAPTAGPMPAEPPTEPEAPLPERLSALVQAERGLSISEAAERLGCHPTLVGRVARDLGLRKVKRGTKRALYPPLPRRDGVPGEVQAVVLDYLDRHPGSSAQSVAARIEASDAWARRVMRTLGCVCKSTNRVSRWYPPPDSEPPIAVPCSDEAPPSPSEQPRPGAGDGAGGDEPSQSAVAPTEPRPPPPEVDADPPSLVPPEADGSVAELELAVLLEALRLALGLDDEGWTADELIAEVHELRERNRRLSALVNRYARALDRGRIPMPPEGEDIGYRLGILVERLQGVARA